MNWRVNVETQFLKLMPNLYRRRIVAIEFGDSVYRRKEPNETSNCDMIIALDFCFPRYV